MILLCIFAGSRPHAFEWVDSRTYLDPARALVSLGRYSASPDQPLRPEFTRTPGYPALAAAVFALFGERVWILSLIGIACAAGTVFLTWTALRGVVTSRLAFWACTFLALDPGAFFHSMDVLSETVFAFVLCAGLSILVRPRLSRNGYGLVAAGASLGAAALIRPILTWCLPVIAVIVWVRGPRGVRRPGLARAGFVLAMALPLLAWSGRNRALGGSFSLAPVTGHQLLHRRAADVIARVQHRRLTDVQEELGIREAFRRFMHPSEAKALFGDDGHRTTFPDTSAVSIWELDRRWRADAVRLMVRHPSETLRGFLEWSAVLLTAPPPLLLSVHYGAVRPSGPLVDAWTNQEWLRLLRIGWSEQPALVCACAILWLFAACVAFLGAAGVVRLLASRRWRGLLIAAVSVYLVASSASTDAADDRYRVPLAPFLYSTAAIGLAWLTRSGGARPAGTPPSTEA